MPSYRYCRRGRTWTRRCAQQAKAKNNHKEFGSDVQAEHPQPNNPRPKLALEIYAKRTNLQAGPLNIHTPFERISTLAGSALINEKRVFYLYRGRDPVRDVELITCCT